tara:strand:+ start:96 stop:743 length:648 start_codon:yes stop_codon:yes gene_type:complete
MKEIAKTYPLQVFRHRIYIPFLNFIDFVNDKKRGIETQKYIKLEDLGIVKTVGSGYESISYKKLKYLFSQSLDNSFTSFLDVGCGLGRPIIVAGEAGFKNLYGVDVSSNLLEKCKENIKKSGFESKLTFSDVLDYKLPSGKLCIFLFNPFGEDKMKYLLNNIESRSEETMIFYHNPVHSNVFNSKYIFKKFSWKHFGLYEEKCFCYLIPANSNIK